MFLKFYEFFSKRFNCLNVERDKNVEFKITENVGNLFSVGEKVSLAHCVSKIKIKLFL